MTAESSSTRRISSLDGLRAVAILCVLFAHSYFSWGAQLNLSPFLLKVWESLGGYGVGLFFALSGFLITRLLIAERERIGRVDLRSFYLRRTLRIIPAFVLYISVVWFLQSQNLYQIDRTSLLVGTFFVKNYRLNGAGDWPVVHLWSLSIEEQFYLVWPAVISFLGVPKA
jgi:peptidoglycan/LPS O-acetylase OafA/YrhL